MMRKCFSVLGVAIVAGLVFAPTGVAHAAGEDCEVVNRVANSNPAFASWDSISPTVSVFGTPATVISCAEQRYYIESFDPSADITHTQHADQWYRVTAQDITVEGRENATQRYLVWTNTENQAVQRYRVMVYDPAVAIGVIPPEEMELPGQGGGEDSSDLWIQAYSGVAEGYVLQYSFDDGNLVCSRDGSVMFPTLASAGALTPGSWGFSAYNGLIQPTTWNPASTAPVEFVRTGMQSGWPFDLWGGMVMVKGSSNILPACEYAQTMNWTITANN